MQIAEGKYHPQDLILTHHGYNLPGILKGLDVLQFLSGSVLGSLSKGHPENPEIAAKILQGYEMLGFRCPDRRRGRWEHRYHL
jgi:6-phosphofructokinase 1